MNLSRNDILKGNYMYPDEPVKLIYTNHFKKRLEERQLGLDCIPTYLKVTKDNIHSGRTFDNKTLTSAVVRLRYTSSRYLFMAYNPWDGAVKTMWFRDARNNRKSSESTIQDNRGEDKI